MFNFVCLATENTEFIEKILKVLCELCGKVLISPSFWALLRITEYHQRLIRCLRCGQNLNPILGKVQRDTFAFRENIHDMRIGFRS